MYRKMCPNSSGHRITVMMCKTAHNQKTKITSRPATTYGQKKSLDSESRLWAFSIKTVSATPWMMLTSVSSISTTIESSSERAAENFITVAPLDKVGSTESASTNSRRV